MALYKIKDFNPDYRSHFDNNDIIGYDLYSGNEKIGSVDDILVDENGQFRYMIINTGVWILGKKVMLPIGQARISYSDHRVYANSLTKTQVEALPEFSSDMALDYDQEERVRGVYRQNAEATPGAIPLESSTSTTYDRDTYSYDRDRDLYDINEQDHANLRLYQERLVASKNRQKTGEVSVGKHVEMDTQRVSVPIEKERVVVERITPSDAGTVVDPSIDAFRDGEVARMEVYEETPDIRKETVVREEVRVRKEVDQETVEMEEQLRREELDINKQGRAVTDQNPTRPLQ